MGTCKFKLIYSTSCSWQEANCALNDGVKVSKINCQCQVRKFTHKRGGFGREGEVGAGSKILWPL